jgi:hypothetical protein
MKSQFYAAALLLLACLTAIWVIYAQNREITQRQAEQKRLARALEQGAAPMTHPSARLEQPTGPPPPELLQLRNEVTRLMQTPRDLDGVREENERLRILLAAHQAKAQEEFSLPPGYVLSSQAQWMGLGTPENTLHSFLWALRMKDLDLFLQTLTPETARDFQQQLKQSAETFDDISVLPGARIASQRQLPDGSVEAMLEIMPGHELEWGWPKVLDLFHFATEDTPPFFFRFVRGEWKLEMPR